MRVLAIGDIHGCSGPLNDLLHWLQPTHDDWVITLGDVVDRGPDTAGVLDRLLELKHQTQLVCLRGNHEVMMLEARRGGRGEQKMWLSVGGVQALGSYSPSPGRTGLLSDVPRAHWDFLEHDLVPYYETGTHIFVHAGATPALAMGEQSDAALYWDFLPDAMRHVSGKRIVCGHTSQKSGVPRRIPGAVCIDTYAHGGGWLTALDVTTNRYWQTNLLGQKREGRLPELD